MTESESSTLTIDGKEYPVESLSETAKKAVVNIRTADQEIAHLQRQLMLAQTARRALAAELKTEIEGLDGAGREKADA